MNCPKAFLVVHALDVVAKEAQGFVAVCLLRTKVVSSAHHGAICTKSYGAGIARIDSFTSPIAGWCIFRPPPSPSDDVLGASEHLDVHRLMIDDYRVEFIRPTIEWHVFLLVSA